MLVPLRLNLYPHYVGGTAPSYDYFPNIAPAKFRLPESEVSPIIESIAEKVIETRQPETEKELELLLMLRLECEGMVFKLEYLELLILEIRKQRFNKAIVLLLLN
jgi:hypothetical protein